MKSNIHRLAGFGLSALASAALILSHSAQAHHSAAPFDFAKTTTIEGTVKSFVVMNPHTHALVTLADAKGTRDIDFEGHSASNFYRAGYVKGAVQPGDHIQLLIAPRRDGRDGIHGDEPTGSRCDHGDVQDHGRGAQRHRAIVFGHSQGDAVIGRDRSPGGP